MQISSGLAVIAPEHVGQCWRGVAQLYNHPKRPPADLSSTCNAPHRSVPESHALLGAQVAMQPALLLLLLLCTSAEHHNKSVNMRLKAQAGLHAASLPCPICAGAKSDRQNSLLPASNTLPIRQTFFPLFAQHFMSPF